MYDYPYRFLLSPQYFSLASTRNQHDQSISLSASVAVTLPTPHQLKLAYPLEDAFRPRYKSDYFPSKGAARRPRYVADDSGNHFVSLQVTKLTEKRNNIKCSSLDPVTDGI